MMNESMCFSLDDGVFVVVGLWCSIDKDDGQGTSSLLHDVSFSSSVLEVDGGDWDGGEDDGEEEEEEEEVLMRARATRRWGLEGWDGRRKRDVCILAAWCGVCVGCRVGADGRKGSVQGPNTRKLTGLHIQDFIFRRGGPIGRCMVSNVVILMLYTRFGIEKKKQQRGLWRFERKCAAETSKRSFPNNNKTFGSHY